MQDLAHGTSTALRSGVLSRTLPIGTELVDADEPGAHVRVWAPTHAKVTLVIEVPTSRSIVLRRDGEYHAAFVPGLATGARYRFQLDGDPTLVPDPASRFQPEGPFGPSEVIDPSAFAWTDDGWRGIAPHRHVLYELHIGTFTPDGTFAAAMQHLPYLAGIGITTIELLPIAEFAGRYNWGYDGVNFFAPSHNYGTPDDVRRFIDRAHACGIAVILDVVYNHFGPSGNTLFAWAPFYRKTGVTTEWGDPFDFDGPHAAGVRAFVNANAGYWISEFHLDGLRIDATQAMVDTSREHILTEIVRTARAAGAPRPIFMIGESEPQDATLFDDLDALWNDDFHHTARVAATGVIEGYVHDYHGTPQELLSAIERGFLYQGQLYPWQRNTRGSPTHGVARARFIHFLENHDQLANGALGERLVGLTDAATFRALTAILLLSPELPMLFQGQEYGARTPWMYFVDHDPDLHGPIRSGRAKFLAQFPRLATPEIQAVLPDPNALATFTRCRLDPTDRQGAPLAQLHRDLLRLRRDDPAFTDPRHASITGAVLSDRAFCVRYFQPRPEDDRLLLVNLGPTFSQGVVPEPLVAPIAGWGWRTLWSSEDPRYGGHGTPTPFTRARLAIPAHAAVLLVPDPTASLRAAVKPPSGDELPVEP